MQNELRSSSSTHRPAAASMIRFGLASLAVALTAPLALQAANISYDESVSGDLSTVPSSPTGISLLIGDNEVHGTTGRAVAGGPVDRDFFRIAIPTGWQLSGIEVLRGTTSAGAGSLSFLGLVKASDFGATAPTDPAALLGYHHYSPTEIGTDILDDLGAAAGAQGFSGALGAGTYSFWVQETAVSSVDYAFNLKVSRVSTVPDAGPQGWLGFATLGMTLFVGRRFARA